MSAQEETTAWLLTLGKNLHAAIGVNELVHIIDSSEVADLPAILTNRCKAIYWQGKDLTVINLAKYFVDRTEIMFKSEPIIGVVAYQSDVDDRLQYAGLLMTSIPIKKIVNNSSACDLPEPVHEWQCLAVSCFYDDGRQVPVLDLQAIFSSPLL